jgi:ribose 5-phosphate isomerase B
MVRTHIAYGSPGKQDTAEAHGAPLGEEEVQRTKENLGWPTEPCWGSDPSIRGGSDMRIAIGVDHGGFPLKGPIVDYLATAGHEVLDLGAHNLDPGDDYPDYAKAVGEAVLRGEAERGIIICGSGVGACVAANKLPGIRAGVCHDTYSAHQGVEHDNINVLCLGARVIGMALALELVRAFIGAAFSGEERHRRRLAKIAEMEKDS